MKIGIFDPYLDDLGGGEKYMLSIAFCLSKQHAVTVFWDNKSDLDKLEERFLLDLSAINVVPNIFSRKTSFIKRILEIKKYDAIIVLSDGSFPYVLSKKLFLHFQQPLQHVPYSWKTKLKLKRVKTIFCNSLFTKSFIDKTFKVNSVVLYPPVNLYPEKVKKENIILNVGRLRVKNIRAKTSIDYKKQTFMIEAFKDMVKSGLKNWEFVLGVSVHDEDKDVFDEIKKSSEGFPVRFLINQNNKKLWDIYNKSKIYWHASGFGEDLEKNPEYAEHFGISTVEAMGAGAVPVVINAGGQKEIVTNNKNGLLWNSLEELKEKTLILIRNPDFMKQLSSSAKERAQFFAGRFCKEVRELIEIDSR